MYAQYLFRISQALHAALAWKYLANCYGVQAGQVDISRPFHLRKKNPFSVDYQPELQLQKAIFSGTHIINAWNISEQCVMYIWVTYGPEVSWITGSLMLEDYWDHLVQPSTHHSPWTAHGSLIQWERGHDAAWLLCPTPQCWMNTTDNYPKPLGWSCLL